MNQRKLDASRVMAKVRRVEVLFLGDELLLGLRANDHLLFLGRHLAAHGLPISVSHEVPDVPEEIIRAVESAWKRADLLITTGGLGPTADDRTRESLAQAIGCRLVHDSRVEAGLHAFFARRGQTPTNNNFRQCSLLEDAIILENLNGTAPGQWLEKDGKVLVMLPGPPRELRPMFFEEVLPRLQALGWTRESKADVQLRSSGIGESLLAERVESALHPFAAEINIAFSAHEGFVDLRLSPLHPQVTASRMKEAAEICEKLLGKDFVGYGEVDVPSLILKHLRSLGQTLAVAESCTGGLLSSRFTDIPGASKVFLGGITCYRNEVKEHLLDIPSSLIEQHTAVSPEVSVAMATGVADMMGADYALSITGYAGPEGGSEPAGTLYLGYVSPLGVWSRKLVCTGTRTTIKERGVNGALDFMRRKLNKYAMHDLLECMRTRA